MFENLEKKSSDLYSQETNICFFRPFPNPNAIIRLFCFPYAGGGCTAFFNWPKHIDQHIEIVCISLPGRDRRFKEEPFRRVHQIVAELKTNFYTMLNKPYAFFGHSLGTRIGFELAKQLRDMGAPEPLHLFMSACCAPHLQDLNSFIYNLPDHEFIKGIKKYDGIPEMILNDSKLLDFFLPVLKADMEAFATYKHTQSSPFSFPISVFGGVSDKITTLSDLEAWCGYTDKAFELYMFKGGHFFINDYQQELLGIISSQLSPYF